MTDITNPSASATRHAKRADRRLLVAAVALTVSMLTTGCQPWGPLTSRYKGHTVVSATGYTNKNAQNVSDTFNLVDPINDGNSVYGKVDYLFWERGIDGVYRWTLEAHDSTPEISNRKATFTESAGLHAESARVRLISYACAQMGFPVPDSCSGPAIVSYDY